MRASWSGLCMVGLSMTLLASCATPEDKSADSAPSAEFALDQNSFTGGVYTFPLDAYIESDEEGLLAGAAEQTLIVECMRGFGFDFKYPATNRERILAGAAQARSRIYGVTDLAAAQKFGYHLNPELERDRSEDPPITPAGNYLLSGEKSGQDLNAVPDVATVSPGQYQGKAIPPGGCIGAARTKLVGSATLIAQYKLGKDLEIMAFDTARQDSRVQRYFTQWSECMSKEGYTYADPLADIEFKLDEPKVSDREIQSAVSNIKCKESTGLLKKWHAVIVEYQNKSIEKNQLALTEEKLKRQSMLAKSTEIVGAAK